MNEFDPSFVSLPDNAAILLRQRLGLSSGERPRVSYLSIAGDIGKSYSTWREFGLDPSVPKATFGHMFFELISKLDAEGQLLTHFDTEISNSGRFRFDRISPPRWGGKITSLRTRLRLRSEVLERVNDFDPHVVVVSSSIQPNAWPKVIKGRRAIAYVHNSLWSANAASVAKLKKRKAAIGSSFDAHLCASDMVADQVRELAGRDLPIQVSVPQIIKALPPNHSKTVRKLLYIGALEKERGLPELLEAFRRAQAKVPELALEVIGNGPLRGGVQAFTADNFTYQPEMRAEHIREALDSADLLVVPSRPERAEGWAEFGAEAVAQRVPLLMSNNVPVAAFMGRAFRQVPAGDARALELAMVDMATSLESYANLLSGFGPEAAEIHDVSLSWGSGLGRALLELPIAEP